MNAWAFINQVLGGGWPPSEMDNMPLDEFMNWYEDAIWRNEEQRKAMNANT